MRPGTSPATSPIATSVAPRGGSPVETCGTLPRNATLRLLLSLLVLLAYLVPARQAAAQACKLSTPVGAGIDEGTKAALQSDNKIVVVGYSVGVNEDFAVVRYNSDCNLDSSFGAGGKVTTPIGAGNEQAIGVAIQPDGKIVAVGFTFTGARKEFAVVRYNTNGSLDTSFNGTGIVTTNINNVGDDARAVAIQSDGKIVVAGWADVVLNAQSRFAVVRYDAAGGLDTSFNGTGIVTTTFGNDAQGHDVAIQSDGKIVVVGDVDMGACCTNWDIALVRYDTNGTLDGTFGAGGIVTTNFFVNDSEFGRGMVIQPGGKILVGGSHNPAAGFNFAAVRYNPSGALDPSFGTGGFVTTDFFASNDTGEDIALQPDGKVLMTGWVRNGAAWEFGVVRYTAGGVLDTTFDLDGKGNDSVGTADDFGRGILFQPDGAIVVVGRADNATRDFGLVRYNTDGSLRAINYRSIGGTNCTAGGNVTTNGTNIVTGSGGMDWVAGNCGTGDLITIAGTPYRVASVDSPTQITVIGTVPTFGPGAHTITRMFSTLALWEDCIDGPGGVACPAGSPSATNASLVVNDRSEVGIVYKGSALTGGLDIFGPITDATHTIRLTANGANRHKGTPDSGVNSVKIAVAAGIAIRVRSDHVTIEWMEITAVAALDGILVESPGGSSTQVVLQYNLIHDVGGAGIGVSMEDIRVDVINNIIYAAAATGIRVGQSLASGSRYRILNNTVYGVVGPGNGGIYKQPGGSSAANTLLVRNNIVVNTGGIAPDYTCNETPPLDGASSNNLSEDGTSCGTGPLTNTVAEVNFVNAGLGNLHINSGSAAENVAADLSAIFMSDIDGGGRTAPWDIGADDVLATTAVELVSFTARGRDGAILLEWETASELNNLGFHLYRARSEWGPYERITAAAIPGLGSSPVGARYRYEDRGLNNGERYFYKLEDIETTGKSELRGPVSATPQAGAADGGDGSILPAPHLTYGEPDAITLHFVERSRDAVILELITEGFHAVAQADGSVAFQIPGFVEEEASGRPALPVKRVLLDAVTGRKVRLVSVQEEDLRRFSSLRPGVAGEPEAAASRRGIVRARRREARPTRGGERLYPEEAARVVSVGFQGQSKKALLELAPLRWDSDSGELVLARRLTVRVEFAGRDLEEHSAEGAPGRRHRERPDDLLGRLITREPGLQAVRYEQVLGWTGRRGLPAGALRLSRQGEPVPFHIEPDEKRFGPGSTLYFLSEGAKSNPYGAEAVFELERGRPGPMMPLRHAAASGEPRSYYLERLEREENHLYQAGLLDAPDVWLWDLIFAPATKSYPFELSGLVLSADAPRLSVWLQGASDMPGLSDHHVRLYVNGALVEEASWEGKHPLRINAELPQALLSEGENALEIENVGDTGASYSMVMLDRFAIRYAREAVVVRDGLEGEWSQSGAAVVRGVSPGSFLLDVTDGPTWLTGASLSGEGNLRFDVEAGRRYLVAGTSALRRPEVKKPSSTRLRSRNNAADYLLITPREFLSAAAPLLERRQSQGLRVSAVPVEDIFAEFGFGEARPEAIREFLAYTYHHWRPPSVRYVLLVGDATYDFKDYLGTGVANRVPPLMIKTSYLWTASDPGYASVNGEDGLPDLAIGRLPAATVGEARAMVEKILAYEDGAAGSRAPVVLVADNPDTAGNFVANADEIAGTVVDASKLRKVYLSVLGVDSTRRSIQDAFDQGAFLMSYVGHGGIHLWANENLFDTSRIGSLHSQRQQALLLTLNCLNGYYHFPYFDSLAEGLLKAEGKGAIAAFSPSGLSLNEPAHVFHQALVRELLSGAHRRLGDAVLAAQEKYAETGVFPELLSIYHLLGDPALRLP